MSFCDHTIHNIRVRIFVYMKTTVHYILYEVFCADQIINKKN
jgi:predicted nucleic acid-binding Zn finger protein